MNTVQRNLIGTNTVRLSSWYRHTCRSGNAAMLWSQRFIQGVFVIVTPVESRAVWKSVKSPLASLPAMDMSCGGVGIRGGVAIAVVRAVGLGKAI